MSLKSIANIWPWSSLFEWITSHFIEPPTIHNTPSFPFLELPAELRLMIYRHYLLHETDILLPIFGQEKQLVGESKGYGPRFPLLFANQQIRVEILEMVFLEYSFVIDVNNSYFRCLAHRQHSPLSVPLRCLRSSQFLTKIELRVHVYTDWIPQQSSPDPLRTWKPTRGGVKGGLDTVCKRLARATQLKTISIVFLPRSPLTMTSSTGFHLIGNLEELSENWASDTPSKEKIFFLLRPLQRVRRACPDVVIHLPKFCRASTAELAKQQRECSVVEKRALQMSELGGYLSEMFEEDRLRSQVTRRGARVWSPLWDSRATIHIYLG